MFGSHGRPQRGRAARVRDAWLDGAAARAPADDRAGAGGDARASRARWSRYRRDGRGNRLARALWAGTRWTRRRVRRLIDARRGFGGRVPIDHVIGPRKLAALARLGLHPPFIAMYSDSALDLPLLRVSRRAVMVEPKARHLARVRRELPEVEVMR